MNTKLASLVLVLTLAATACTDPDRSSSGRQDPDSSVPGVHATPTPTDTVLPPAAFGVQMESTSVLTPYPTVTPHPIFGKELNPDLFDWLDVPDWNWLPILLP